MFQFLDILYMQLGIRYYNKISFEYSVVKNIKQTTQHFFVFSLICSVGCVHPKFRPSNQLKN